MLLNRLEYVLMNNPIRASVQRHVEAPRMRDLGGVLSGGTVLEVGCGRGVGVQIILDMFGARYVHAFDLDPRMIARARVRLQSYGDRVCLWTGDAEAIAAPAARYDAVFDFGILHHLPDWRRGVAEMARVLKPGGVFYGEEVLRPFIVHPVIRRLLAHPQVDRFDEREFAEALRATGFEAVNRLRFGRAFAWFTAVRDDRPAL
jgi:ubiquinone/menaquinone biosynthesis C-methylase UbiE